MGEAKIANRLSLAPRIILPLLVAVAAPLVSCLAVGAILEWPRYVTLDIAAPDSDLPNGDWSNTQRSVLIWRDPYNRSFIWRREGSARADKFPTWDAVAAYFNSWLTSNGWQPHPLLYNNCQNWLPESRFLDPGANDSLAYYRPPADPFGEIPLVCIAIIPYSYSDEIDGFDVILVTGNPSLLSRFWAAWE